jgi:hypothetical protein
VAAAVEAEGETGGLAEREHVELPRFPRLRVDSKLPWVRVVTVRAVTAREVEGREARARPLSRPQIFRRTAVFSST